MEHSIPYARTDCCSARAKDIAKWLKVDELLNWTQKLPRDVEFQVLLDFLVEFAGGLELAEHRMYETMTEQSVESRSAWRMAVARIEVRLGELFRQPEPSAEQFIDDFLKEARTQNEH